MVTFSQILLERPFLISILTVIGALSPALTFAALFQIKEWRLDRLKEHVRQEGWIGQLFGQTRSAFLVIYLIQYAIGLLALRDMNNDGPGFIVIAGLLITIPIWLLAFSLLSILQITLRRQRKPVWTTKAILMVSLALLLTIIGAWFISPQAIGALTLPLLPLIQPIFIFAAWLLLLPLDHFLKQRTFQRARLMRSQLHNPIVIGIAGSVGKTTAKELLATVLADLHPLVTPEHVNTEMGVSQWLIEQMQNAKCKMQNDCVLIVEMGAYRKGEIALLSSIVQPTIGVVTALGSDHLALFGSEEAIIEANGELIEALPSDGHAFLYGDNPGARSLTDKSPCPVTLVGMQTHNDLQANITKESPNGLVFSITNEQRTTNNEQTMSSIVAPIHGTHNIGNILLAVAVARHLGINDDRIRELLALHRPLRTTFNVRRERDVLLLNDTYNISPLSLRAAIAWAENRTERPRVLLTSGLLETGPEEDRFHEELGACAKGKLERVIFTTNRGRTAFTRGYGANVELMTPATHPVSSGSALLCVGRMTPATIRQMMPRQ